MMTTMIAAALAAAQPAELPEGIADLIEQAGETGDAAALDTVMGLARASYPDRLDRLSVLETSARARLAERAEAQAAAEREALREASFVENWAGRGELGGFYATGSSEEAGVSAGVKLVREGIDWRHNFNAHVDYRESAGSTTREQFLAGYEPNYEINERLFAYGLVQGERDRFQGIDSRLSLSAGAGYRIFDADDRSLSIKGGPAYRRTNRIGAPGDEQIAALAALTGNWQISDTFGITQDADAYFAEGNSTFRSETGLEADLGGNLLARVAFRIDHETSPPIGAEATDTLTRITLVYDFE
ncbi:DUF481 domain-containing protein [Sphingomicrobium sp. XHP0239]|uniref:DUF481 domain-containing protein n=1 Tax=Sphingomicrobium maritimum TaxID=3133972 RepID=UPI0031CC43A6